MVPANLRFTLVELNQLLAPVKFNSNNERDKFAELIIYLQDNFSAGGVVSIAYADLLALHGGGTLEQGTFYLINDFQSTIEISGGGGATDVGAIEPLIVYASANDQLDTEALSVLFPEDRIFYSITDVLFGATTGRIYKRIETIKNLEYPSDFRVQRVRRWETAAASGIFSVPFDNGEAFVDNFVFGASDGGSCTDCFVKTAIFGGIPQDMNISFQGTCLGCTVFSTNSTVINGSNVNLIGGDQNELRGNNNQVNIYGAQTILSDSASRINVGAGCVLNTFGNNCSAITLEENCTTNTFGNDCQFITLGQSNSLCNFGANIFSCTFGSNNASVTVGDLCNSIHIGTGNTAIIFGSSVIDFTMGSINNNCTIGNDCLINQMGTANDTINMGDLCSGIILADNIANRTFSPSRSEHEEFATHGRLVVLYDFAVQGGAQGTINLARIPNNSNILTSFIDVETAGTSGGPATVEFGVAVDDPAGILAASPIGSFTPGLQPTIQDGQVGNATAITTAQRFVNMVIAGADLTGGKWTLTIEWTTRK